jgi:diacylglycerol kinase family enzyme
MLVQTQRVRNASMAQADLTAEPKVAVLLNANAKRVSDKVIRRVSHVVPEEDLYLSRSLSDVKAIAAKVVAGKYHTVFTGGGDGTFMSFASAIFAEMAKQGVSRPPRFGVLKLGTGNSLANLVGASSLSGDGILDDILRARAGEVPSVRRVDLIDFEGTVAPMLGLGYDGAVLNDYVGVTRAAGPAKPLVAGGVGYFAAIALKTLPHYLMHQKAVQGEVICEGRGMRMNDDGTAGQQYAKGDVMYRGPLRILCAGTVPCYGFNFKMFPFAGKKRGMMQVRVANTNPLSIISRLPAAWNGTFRHPDMHDFLVDQVSLRFEREMPLQVGGDAWGYRQEMKFGVGERPADLLDFTAALN